ncbi:MAG: membrane protein insertion efficiency factor YidD, partial [Candidatus Gracilibacteria bacterium]
LLILENFAFMTFFLGFLKFVSYLPRYAVVFLVKGYQKTLSPDHGFLKRFFPHGYCKFSPTCSSYAILSITKYGVFHGGAKAIFRIFKCNPWSKGGIDEVR